MWKCKKLALQIDHTNGNNSDNRKENLRILCPNCHSQTNTFCGRNNKVKIKKIPTNRPRKVERPSKQKLRNLLWKHPTSHLSKQFGVSDKAVEKWAKIYKVAKPPPGYWQRKPEEQGKIRQKMLSIYRPNEP